MPLVVPHPLLRRPALGVPGLGHGGEQRLAHLHEEGALRGVEAGVVADLWFCLGGFAVVGWVG
jgi:hypothetical protein